MIKTLRSARNRAMEATHYAADMQRFREWLLTHPEKCDPEVRRAAINWTEVQAAEVLRENENARLAGRTSMRTRLKELVVAIIAHSAATLKEEA